MLELAIVKMTKIQEKTLMRKIRKTQKKKDQFQQQLKQEKSQQVKRSQEDVDAEIGSSKLCFSKC